MVFIQTELSEIGKIVTVTLRKTVVVTAGLSLSQTVNIFL